MPAGLVGERYRLHQPLGHGGVSVVWRGRDERLDRPVAVKLLTPAALDDPAALTRFDREARTIARLTHPNIVGVYDLGVDGGTPYLVLELVEGPSLAVVLADGPLPVSQAVDLASQTCRGLIAAHRAGIVHRDIKPGNLLLAPDGTLKICDFGIAYLQHTPSHGSLTGAGTAVGTSLYMAPEQASGRSVDARADLYALGCLLYATLTGNPPFSGGNPIAVAYQQVHQAPIPVEHKRPGTPPELAALVNQLLAKEPADRPASAEEVHTRLATLADTGAAPAPAATAPPVSAEFGDRPRAAAGVSPPTRILPDTAAGPAPASRRSLRGRPATALAAALTAILLAALAAALLPDRRDQGSDRVAGRPPSASPTASAVPTPAAASPTEPSNTDFPTPPAAQPANLIAEIRADLPRLVAAGHLDEDSAEELDKRLDEALAALAENKADKTAEKVRQATEKVAKLRDEGKLTEAGYQRLTIALNRLTRTIPSP